MKKFILLGSFIISQLGFARLPEMIHPDSATPWVERQSHTLFLNGRAIHTATLFSVKLYEISLFLEKPTIDPDEILKSSTLKLVQLKFLRNVGADQLRSSFTDGFLENCGRQCDRLKVYLDQLNSQIPDLREGDSLEFLVLPSKIIFRSSLGNYSEVNSNDFARILLSIWLGPSPPSSQLKRKILGLSSD